jgi:hypothetical protein
VKIVKINGPLLVCFVSSIDPEGLHKRNKVYVKLGTGYGKNSKILRMEIFDSDALQTFSTDGPILVASKASPKKEWFTEAHLIVEKGVAKGLIGFVAEFSKKLD